MDVINIYWDAEYECFQPASGYWHEDGFCWPEPPTEE